MLKLISKTYFRNLFVKLLISNPFRKLKRTKKLAIEERNVRYILFERKSDYCYTDVFF